jgi:hypothetical protein
LKPPGIAKNLAGRARIRLVTDVHHGPCDASRAANLKHSRTLGRVVGYIRNFGPFEGGFDVIAGKAAVLEEARLATTVLPVCRHLITELAPPDLSRQRVEVRARLKARIDEARRETQGGELLPDAIRPLPALGMPAQENLDVTLVVDQSLGGELVDTGADRVGIEAFVGELAEKLGRAVFAT